MLDQLLERIEAVAADDGESDFFLNAGEIGKMAGPGFLAQGRKEKEFVEGLRIAGLLFQQSPESRISIEEQFLEATGVHVKNGLA